MRVGMSKVAVIEFVELLRMSTLGPLHVAVELGRAWGQDEEADAELLASGLEVCHELGTSIHLNGLDGEGNLRRMDSRKWAARLEVARVCTSPAHPTWRPHPLR